jgi:catechol 2,3-dioxygenase-like lactoylglutathione lyase family enzyme
VPLREERHFSFGRVIVARMTTAIRKLTALAYVQNVPASIAFYERLGFKVSNTFVPPHANEPVWAWLDSDGASLMVSLASGPVDAGQQAILFYLYVDDVEAKHAELTAAGIAVGPINNPFYNPRGEFRFEDPDGYVLWIAHT